jgi:MFS family permease
MRGWMVTLLLALASVVSQFDRTVVNLAVAPIKARFALDDTHFGMLQGVAFGLFYVIACVPIGRLSDRYQRRLILGSSLGLFSLFSMASGLAGSYAQLMLTRIGVGVGEASLTPAGYSLLSDHFPPSRLGRPMGAFMMSSAIGQGIAFILGGSLLQWLSTSSFLQSGLLAGFAPWQAAFVIVGFPGLLLVPFFLLMREPARRGPGAAEALSVKEVFAIVRDRRSALVPMFAGLTMVPLVTYAFFIWTPALFERSYGWTPAQVGLGFGMIMLIFGTAGAYFGGWATDWLARRGRLDAPLLVAAFGFFCCGLFAVIAPLMPTAKAALILLVPVTFFNTSPYAAAATAIQLIVPNRARAQVNALYITLTTLVGLTIGPVLVGLMTDHVFRNPADLRYAISIMAGFPPPIMVVLILIARRPYRALREQFTMTGA